MKHADLSPIRRTSVSLRTANRKSLQKAAVSLQEQGIPFSEQRLMRECLRIALRFWRGRKEIARRNRRYNKCEGPYEIAPFYTSEALRSVAWTRCHHSGISLSRLMDFAITRYLPRVMEYWLRFEYRGRDKADAAIWRQRYAQRRNRDDFVISYHAYTRINDGIILDYGEKSEILPWPPQLAVVA